MKPYLQAIGFIVGFFLVSNLVYNFLTHGFDKNKAVLYNSISDHFSKAEIFYIHGNMEAGYQEYNTAISCWKEYNNKYTLFYKGTP